MTCVIKKLLSLSYCLIGSVMEIKCRADCVWWGGGGHRTWKQTDSTLKMLASSQVLYSFSLERDLSIVMVVFCLLSKPSFGTA